MGPKSKAAKTTSGDKGFRSKKSKIGRQENESGAKAKKRKGDDTFKPKVKKFKSNKEIEKTRTSSPGGDMTRGKVEKTSSGFKPGKNKNDKGAGEKTGKRKLTSDNKKFQSGAKKFRKDDKSDEKEKGRNSHMQYQCLMFENPGCE